METLTKVKYPGIKVTTNGNQLVSYYTESLIADAGVFYPITPSTEMGENFQMCYSQGKLNAFGESLIAIETEGEHAAQGGAIAIAVTGKRVVNFTSGQGIVYGLEQYFHAPGKLCTMVLEVGARALTKHALNVHCGHDDIYSAMEAGWIMLFAKDAQQAADQSIILRRVTELSLNPGINIQDGFLTTHLERNFLRAEPELIREYLGHPTDIIECPTEAQKILFGATRRRIPEMIDLKRPMLLGPVQNQEHYMNGVAARRNNFSEPILSFLKQAYEDFAKLTGREYGLISKYQTEAADTIFICMGSAAENIEAVCDYLNKTRGVKVGVVHINVLNPFPEIELLKTIVHAKNVIVLERSDNSLATDNPLTKIVRAMINKAMDNYKEGDFAHFSIDSQTVIPQVFSGVYGLGSRDFRPEDIIGAYDFVEGRCYRKDGASRKSGSRFFYLGIDHPYAVTSSEKPSCLPDKSIAIRFHSIGGWGMITTGKNLSEIIGTISEEICKRDNLKNEDGSYKELIHVSANPKYGSEKKGAPTNYFLVAAPERIRVNCDLKHVNVVLCCDPKIFLHTDPLVGMEEGGSFVWESDEPTPEDAWKRIPLKQRQEIIDKKIRVYILNGFKIAREATPRPDLQLRMQGNAFLGAFFGVSTFLEDYGITEEQYLNIVRAQYVKKFGKFGGAVIESNMKVMQAGFEQVKLIENFDADAKDKSSMTDPLILPKLQCKEACEKEHAPIYKRSTFDKEFRSGMGYNQPASPLASVGMMAAATGATASKQVARRSIPKWNVANCTQCMECITICPDSALPNTAQPINVLLETAVKNYLSEEQDKQLILDQLPEIISKVRVKMQANIDAKSFEENFNQIVLKEFKDIFRKDLSEQSVQEFERVIECLPVAYEKTTGIFKNKEKKEKGSGGVFSIYVNDLCKGCAACVDACGDHQALTMVEEDDEDIAKTRSAVHFLDLLPDTPKEYLGLFDSSSPHDSKAATLRYHLMLQSKYQSFVAGDGACAGCGEKSTLRSIVTLTETLMRPIFKSKAERLKSKSEQLKDSGLKLLNHLEEKDLQSYNIFRKTILHMLLGLGAESNEATLKRIEENFDGGNAELVEAITLVMETDARHHGNYRIEKGELYEGMQVMAMGANTGCNTVFGSTPPNNPHPYPWMNSLFQDGSTISWLIAESFIQNHARRSVIPERLCDFLLASEQKIFTERDYFKYTHFSDLYMNEMEILELPKVWAIGGDGGMGDIGFQNLSKVILQNRPNVKVLMLNTQVYSNTGGQNSDSSVMTGGFDMNQFGDASEGKMTELKSVAESFLSGHGSPYLAQVSIANTATLYKSVVDGLCYRGTAFFQVFTTCQPEHGVPDSASLIQAQRIRDSRVLHEFIFTPNAGETYTECLSIKGNPQNKKDWMQKKIPGSVEKYNYTTAHWCFSEVRFRRHHNVAKSADEVKKLEHLDDALMRISMKDITNRNYLDPEHHSFIPRFGVYTIDYKEDGTPVYHILSRHMVVFCIERRKAWRLAQSRAGIENEDYKTQQEFLKQFEEN